MSGAPTIESVNLLQITDTHLFSDDSGELLGITPNTSFDSVLDEIDAASFSFDAILATGDIAQDQSSQAYTKFTQGIARWSQLCYWLEGNHDKKNTMQVCMHNAQVKDEKCIEIGANWVVIMLDSQVEGEPYGFLSSSQFDFLKKSLSAYSDHHVLICMHHHPRPVGSAWLDQHQLKNADEFWLSIASCSQVKAVLCGHVHQNFTEYYQGVRVMTTPSTCIQFKMNSDDFALDELQPGWRILTLTSDGDIQTQVYRLQHSLYLPCLESTGY